MGGPGGVREHCIEDGDEAVVLDGELRVIVRVLSADEEYSRLGEWV